MRDRHALMLTAWRDLTRNPRGVSYLDPGTLAQAGTAQAGRRPKRHAEGSGDLAGRSVIDPTPQPRASCYAAEVRVTSYSHPALWIAARCGSSAEIPSGQYCILLDRGRPTKVSRHDEEGRQCPCTNTTVTSVSARSR